MIPPARISISLLLPLALSGCFVKVSGLETTGGGSRTTTTSSQVAGTARFSHGAASFSSGPRVSPSAPGGHATLGKGASGVLIVGLVFADLWSYIVGPSQSRPLSPDEKIMDTCSCYQKPVTGNE
jgi:hypothetical protein